MKLQQFAKIYYAIYVLVKETFINQILQEHNPAVTIDLCSVSLNLLDICIQISSFTM